MPNPQNLRPHNRKGPAKPAMVILRILVRNAATMPDLRRLTGMPTRRVRQQIEWLKKGGAIRRRELRDRGIGKGQGGCLAVYDAVIHKL